MQGRPNNEAELEHLEIQVRHARHSIHRTELKVEAIEASIHDMEKFYPKIKIIHRPADPREDGFSLFAENLLLRPA